MEVHHHPDLHHRKKKWKEYFLEFLMIFLAVTLGYLAETMRENISERHREKDYIVGLINNLQNDTTALNGLIQRNDKELRGMDSLMKISKSKFTDYAVQDSIFYYAIQYTLDLHIFQFNDLTLVQLRNAGGYSLIQNSKVADSIALYEFKNNDIKIQERFVIDYYGQTTATFRQIFDVTLLKPFFHAYTITNRIPTDIHVIFSKDTEKMHLLFNNYWIFDLTLNYYRTMLNDHIKYLGGFIVFLKRKYDLG